MIGLIQRVSHAHVTVEQQVIGNIQQGILLFLGIEKEDTETKAERLLQRIITYRIFEDSNRRMNRSLMDIKGDLLIISQFTLPANTQKGTRPSFTPAAPTLLAKTLYDHFIEHAQLSVSHVATGQFGTDMQVSLTNNGPVTFWLQV